MKHLHMLMAFVSMALFIAQSGLILAHKPIPKPLKIASHTIYLLLIIPALVMAWQLHQAGARLDWAYAKIVLFLVAISTSVKITRANQLSHARIGMVVGAIAYIGIVWLAFAKPVLGAV